MLPLVLQLADALQFAHNAKVTYQNFKMSNILVLEPKKKLAQLDIALVDFSVMQQDSYVPDVLSGLAYIAPERWEGTMLPASDQYGLAAISYELFTGRPPFQGASSNIMKILHTTKLPQSPTTLNAKLPSALNGILLRALAKKPSDRFASIAHFAQALQSC
jgi:serine/threonine protein kinase